TYTLHDATHARNVAELIAKLLGQRIDELSALEAALLILSAYFHDIGMVFAPDELAGLQDEPEWQIFLRSHPEAYLAVEGRPTPTVEVAEWYCRWRHADRVF